MTVAINGSTGITGAPLQRGTETATTSGTTVVVATGIPDWVSRVTVMLYGVSTSGTSMPLIQFGTGSTPTYTTSGYVSSSDNYTSTPGPSASSTAGFRIGSSAAATTLWYVAYTFVSLGSNKWVGSMVGATASGAGVAYSGGGVTLSGALTAIRLNTVNGTDTFDAGTVNYIYE